MKKHAFLFIFLFSVSFSLLMAQDTYHTNLKNRLQTDYGITGGTWMFSADEAANASSTTGGSLVSVTGQSFTKARRIDCTGQTNVANNSINLVCPSSITNGDRLLMIFWARTVSAPNNRGCGSFIFMDNASPWTKYRKFEQRFGTTWKEYIVPVQVSKELAATKAKFMAELAVQTQTLEIGGITAINYGTTYTLAQLPRKTNDEYDGMEENAAWRTQAEARIEQLRKGNINLSVLNSNNQPIQNAQVTIEMLRHEFSWGTAIQENKVFTGSSSYDATYASKLFNLDGRGHGFNMVVMENGHKWVQWENIWPLSHANNAKLVNILKAKLVDTRGHTLVWPGWGNMPTYMESNKTNFSYLKTKVNDHLTEMLTYPGIQGSVKEWDVLNEVNGNTSLATALAGNTVDGTSYNTGREIYAEIFNKVKQLDPTVKRYLNDHVYASAYGKGEVWKDKVREIIANGATIDGLGFQWHEQFMMAPQEVYDIFTDYHNITGAMCKITEYDSEILASSELYSKYFRDLLTICFSHPYCDGFLMWGFWSGTSWKAPIFNSDWSLKTTAQPFVDLLFNKWWTPTATLTPDQTGKTSLRGFKGYYKVTITTGNEQFIDTIKVFNDVNLNYKYPFVKATGLKELKTSKLNIYPNPATEYFTINRNQQENCFVRILNLNGQVVKSFATSGQQIKVVSSKLKPGIYLVEVKDSEQISCDRIIIN
ncbi:MAG: endo-1,4-beta-xylanase [Salinivirgaceae bacterium]|jgi:endo-1,4-beta-xylanase|nr:endo-1,4-beta-xylanase [Salinivirgaceae bacterium]